MEHFAKVILRHPKLLLAVVVALSVLIFALSFRGVLPEDHGSLLFRAGLIFGGFGAVVGFAAGLLAGRLDGWRAELATVTAVEAEAN